MTGRHTVCVTLASETTLISLAHIWQNWKN